MDWLAAVLFANKCAATLFDIAEDSQLECVQVISMLPHAVLWGASGSCLRAAKQVSLLST